MTALDSVGYGRRSAPSQGAADTPSAPVATLAALAGLLAERGGEAALVQLTRRAAGTADGGAEVWSDTALARAAARTALGLQAAGVAPGERVLLYAPTSPRWIIACLGLLRLGAVPVPVDSQADAADLAQIVAGSEARRAFTTAQSAPRLTEAATAAGLEPILLDRDGSADDAGGDAPQAVEGLPETDTPSSLAALAGSLDPESSGAEPVDESALPEPPDPDAEAVLFFTSGTSGPPKGVPLTHRNLLSNLAAILAEDIVTEADRLLLPLPLHHVYPFSLGLLAPLVRGVPIVLPQALTGAALARALDAGDVSLILGIPRLYAALLDAVERRIGAGGRLARWAFHGLLRLATVLRRHGLSVGRPLFAPLRRRIAPGLRLLVSGGAALDPGLGERLEVLGWTVATGYGLTETAPILTVMRPGEGRFDTAGRALPGVELRIAARHENADSPSEGETQPGEVQARGPNVFSGYLGTSSAADDPFTDDNWLGTGDLGTLDSDGWLRLSGRASARIVLAGGENVDPESVEARLDDAAAIAESGVLGHDGVLAAVLVPDPDTARGADPETLRKRLREAAQAALADAPSWRRPSHIQVDRRPLPRTRLGKLRRGRLRERFDALRAGEAEPAAAGLLPRAELAPDDRALIDDPAVARIWDWLGERFADRRITPDTDLQLDLGVDSLEWVAMGLELQDAAGLALDEDAIGRVATVRDLLQEAVAAGRAASDGQVEDLEHRLADAQAMLDADQRERLEPPGRGAALLAAVLQALARLVMRRWLRLDARGIEHLPTKGPCILAPNHESVLDPIVIAAVLSPAQRRNTFWGGFTERMFATPWMRLVSRAYRVLPVAPAKRPVTSLAYGAAALSRGGLLVWFPEGRRHPDEEIGPFRPGVGSLARAQQAVMVPCAIRNTGAALPPGAWWP
ncbi:MAG: AMP-binding protein, partial [Gammaproteobacteria bacterium]|nr:AMP-binding protein [Gammaproteobacteria bacterium]